MGKQWQRKLLEDEVRELRAWWRIREAAYLAYVTTPNPRQKGLEMGLSAGCVRKAAMGQTYKEIK